MPPEYVATVHGYHPIGNVSADIVRVDGRWPGISNGSFELLPGVHELEVSCMFGEDDACPTGWVKHKFSGGRHYQVRPVGQIWNWTDGDVCEVEVVKLDGPPRAVAGVPLPY